MVLISCVYLYPFPTTMYSLSAISPSMASSLSLFLMSPTILSPQWRRGPGSGSRSVGLIKIGLSPSTNISGRNTDRPVDLALLSPAADFQQPVDFIS